MKTWDVIVIGGGIIGLSLSLELRRSGARILVVERGEPGREASHAAGGMLVDSDVETKSALLALAKASARMYPEFVREVELESGMKADLRDQGTIVFHGAEESDQAAKSGLKSLSAAELRELEPGLAESELAASRLAAYYLEERSVDPRALTVAVLNAARRSGVDFSSGDEVLGVNISDGAVSGVTTNKTYFLASKVVNCAGAWSGQIAPHAFPTRPVKGQMLCLLAPTRELLKHVIRTPEIYLIPRSDGRILAGATVEEAGFDKRTDTETIKRLHRAAIATVPELKNAKILEDWAGLRPRTPDSLPILGATATPGYFVATGHFRDGILLAPVTARVMAQVMEGRITDHDIGAFSPARFSAGG
jgi:glycine oxidase